MAFQNVIMPKIKLVHGVSKQVIDPVSVVGNGSREVRRKQNRYERFAWSYPSRSILQASKQELVTFFKTVNMGLDSFLIQDPDQPEFVNTQYYGVMAVPDAGYQDYWYFETAGNGTGHPIFNYYDMTQLDVKINGESYWPDWTVYYHPTNGRPMIWVPDSFAGAQYNGGSVAHAMVLNGPIYMTVRLNSTLSWTISAMEKSALGTDCNPTPTIVDISDISLIEVFEHA